jgi:hypothetical protein
MRKPERLSVVLDHHGRRSFAPVGKYICGRGQGWELSVWKWRTLMLAKLGQA